MVPDLPEALIAGKERDFLSYFYRKYCYDPTAIGPDDIDEYLRTFAGLGGVRGALGVYRAIFETEAQVRERLGGEDKLRMPVLALGGALSLGKHAAEMMRQVAEDVRGGPVERCGHFIAEERPEYLAERLLAFWEEDDATGTTG
jgi:pimeloyl-ACP methyl ester carboxylesterase